MTDVADPVVVTEAGTWYVFGFANRPVDALPSGPLGQPQLVAIDGLDAWAIVAPSPADTAWQDAEPELLAEAAVHHDAVLRAALASDVVPARFGGTVARLDDLRLLGALQLDELRAAFERTAGRDEYDVRLVGRRPRVRAASGRDYLAQRADRLRGGGAIGAAVTSIVERWPESIVRGCDDERARIAILHDERSGSLTDLVRSVVDDDVEVTITGPLPPYSFVRSQGDDHGADA